MSPESNQHSGLDFTQVPNDEQIVAAFKAWAMADADPATEWRIERAHARRLVEQLAAAQTERDVLREALEAMLPGRTGSEREYLTNAAYHACVHHAMKALETLSIPNRDEQNPATEPEGQ